MNLRNCLFDDDFDEIGKKSFPKGIGRLICLRTLSCFPVGVGSEGDEICKLGESENLNHIQGKLAIVGLKNVVDLGEVKNALKKKMHLCALYLFFKSNEEIEEETEERRRRRRRMENDVATFVV